MDAPIVLRRFAQKVFSDSSSCKRIASGTRLSSPSTRQRPLRAQSRPFTTTSQKRRDTPPQPQPLSQTEGTADVVDSNPLQKRQQTQTQRLQGSSGPKPDPNNRIDLSSLSNAPPSRQSRAPGSASAQLDVLFGRSQLRRDSPGENRFQRAIRQTDAMDGILPGFQATKEPFSIKSLLNDTYSGIDQDRGLHSAAELPLRLRPTLGRTQSVDNTRGMDVNRAFRTLEMKCAANGVKRDFNKQRFHVRRGQRRKIERSLRWRTVFKAGFLEECARVRRMKNQGW